ncbi:MAG: homoserine kinase [Neisseriaceae bacterium]|nr:homoserine kinase [Neisseriaceae bacterium]
MSVYTTVSEADLHAFLRDYQIGEYNAHHGIAGGITNTNYFLDTTQGRFVLTIFETLKAEELPFFMHLKDHLNQRGVACPAPLKRLDGSFIGFLHQKPATVISYLKGKDIQNPNVQQCFAVGAMLAKMHLASQDFSMTVRNQRDWDWFQNAAQKVMNQLSDTDSALLKNELIQLSGCLKDLPQGIIHADLFRDNVLMHENEVAGFIDFYYACQGVLLYDLAIALNDWTRCEQNDACILNQVLYQSMLQGYESIRPLTLQEKQSLPLAHRMAALRFWLSRLLDFYFPTEGELTFTKDPQVFGNLLRYFQTFSM